MAAEPERRRRRRRWWGPGGEDGDPGDGLAAAAARLRRRLRARRGKTRLRLSPGGAGRRAQPGPAFQNEQEDRPAHEGEERASAAPGPPTPFLSSSCFPSPRFSPAVAAAAMWPRRGWISGLVLSPCAGGGRVRCLKAGPGAAALPPGATSVPGDRRAPCRGPAVEAPAYRGGREERVSGQGPSRGTAAVQVPDSFCPNSL